jgi:xylulokinase
MRVAGGGARSPLWRQIQRDVFELPVCATAADHGAAYGAALLAAVGAGAFATAADAARAVPLGARSAPAPDQVAAYDAIYRRYRRLYPALRAEFAAD